MRLVTFLSAIVAPVVVGALIPVAVGQTPPTANQIINSLLPRPGSGELTRGIRPAKPGESPGGAPQSLPRGEAGSTPGGPPLATQPAVGDVGSINLYITFYTDSAEITPAALRTLAVLGDALSSQALAAYRFRIEGHTDTVGSREYNKGLSERRAQAVVDYVITKYRFDPSRLEAIGLGKEDLLIHTPDQTPEWRNRRVQIVNVGH